MGYPGWRLMVLGLFTLGATACTLTVAGQGPPPDVVIGRPRTIAVPAGHDPPPGECRVWYPDRPPGHQPPPGPCRHLAAGPGAFILHNGKAWDADYDWQAYAQRHPGLVPDVILHIKSR